jgi:hypothetical protein
MLRRNNVLDFLHCTIYTGCMRYLLTMLIVNLVAHPVLAQNLSPIQQYLKNETGYYAATQPSAAPSQTDALPQASQPFAPQVALSPVQQYLQKETGYYIPPATQPVPSDVPPQQTAVATSIPLSIMDY